MPKRRGQMEMIRDLLLAIAMAPGQKELPTRIMYAIGTSWITMNGREADPEKGRAAEEGLIGFALRKNLVEDLGPPAVPYTGRQARRRDKRSNSIYKITDKGLLVLRLMDLLWVFIEGDEPQVRVPPAIMRILARATNYGEQLEDVVQHIVYKPQVSSENLAIDNLLSDMKYESLIINEGRLDTELLSSALNVVVEDAEQRTIIHETEPIAQLVTDMPAEFFVARVIEGVEKLGTQLGEHGTPKIVDADTTFIQRIDLSNYSAKDGYHCPLCSYKTYSVRPKNTLQRHFKTKHPDYELDFG